MSSSLSIITNPAMWSASYSPFLFHGSTGTFGRPNLCYGHALKNDIFFTSDQSPDVTFAVTTGWTINHPATLRSNLRQEGFEVITDKDVIDQYKDTIIECFDVSRHPSIIVKAVNVGHLTYFATPTNTPSSNAEVALIDNGKSNDDTEGEEKNDSSPSTLKRPNTTVLRSAREAMRHSYPSTEIALIVVFSLIFIWWPIPVAVIYVCWAAVRRHRQKGEQYDNWIMAPLGLSAIETEHWITWRGRALATRIPD